MKCDVVTIRNLKVNCVVGWFDEERATPQPLEVTISVNYDARRAARDGRLSSTIDYARLAGEARFILEAGRFRLLESAAEALAAWVLAPSSSHLPPTTANAVEVELVKPEVLGGVAVPSVRIARVPSDFEVCVEVKAFGLVEVIFETAECGLYRERIGPGKVLPTHVHYTLDESELVLGNGLLLQGKPVAAGLAHSWPRAFPHRYENPTGEEASFLCIDRPKFRPDDEVEVAVPVADLRLPTSIRYF